MGRTYIPCFYTQTTPKPLFVLDYYLLCIFDPFIQLDFRFETKGTTEN